MTMPHERTRAVLQTYEFLVELSKNRSLPEKVRRDASFLLRHYPTEHDLLLAGKIEEQMENLPLGAFGPVFSSTSELKRPHSPD